MEQQYGDDFISITDEDGKEYELEVLAELEHDGSRYLALVPAGSGDMRPRILRSASSSPWRKTARNSLRPLKTTQSLRRSTVR